MSGQWNDLPHTPIQRSIAEVVEQIRADVNDKRRDDTKEEEIQHLMNAIHSLGEAIGTRFKEQIEEEEAERQAEYMRKRAIKHASYWIKLKGTPPTDDVTAHVWLREASRTSDPQQSFVTLPLDRARAFRTFDDVAKWIVTYLPKYNPHTFEIVKVLNNNEVVRNTASAEEYAALFQQLPKEDDKC